MPTEKKGQINPIKIGVDMSFFWYGRSGLSVDSLNVLRLIREIKWSKTYPLLWDAKGKVNLIANPIKNFDSFVEFLGQSPSHNPGKLKVQVATLARILELAFRGPRCFHLNKSQINQLYKKFPRLGAVNNLPWVLIHPSANIFYEVAKYAPSKLIEKIFRPYAAHKLNCDLDVVIYHYPRFLLFKNAVHIVKIHDLIPLKYENEPKPYQTLKHALDKIIAEKWPFVFVTPTEVIKKELLDYSPYFKDKTFVVPNVIQPISTEFYSRQQTLKKIGIEKAKTKYFIQIGTIQPNKNYKLTLTAFDQVLSKVSDIKLVIVGTVRLIDDATLKLLNELKEKKAIIHLQNIPTTLLFSLLKHAEALIFPSEYEGFGLPPIEALAVGTIPIVKDMPVFKETLGKQAIFVKNTRDLINAMIRVLKQPVKVTPHIPRQFTEQAVRQRWSEVILKVINAKQNLQGA